MCGDFASVQRTVVHPAPSELPGIDILSFTIDLGAAPSVQLPVSLLVVSSGPVINFLNLALGLGSVALVQLTLARHGS